MLSAQYPIVEGLTALLFMCVAYVTVLEVTATSILLSLPYLVVIGLLIVIGAYDIRHTIIPDIPVYTLIALSFGMLFFSGGDLVSPTLGALLAGPAVASPLALLWLLSRGRLMGLGDAKLALALGWLLGFSGAGTMLVLSFWIGALVGVTLLVLSHVVHDLRLSAGSRQLTMKSEVAFGPFLIAAYLIVFFFNFNLVTVLSF